jgi:hypothetical protein
MGTYGRARVQDALSWAHEAPKLLAAYDAVFDAPEALASPKPRHAE